MIIADIQEDRVNFAVQHGFADASVVVPMKRPETIEEKLEFAKEVAGLVKAAKIDGKPAGEVTRHLRVHWRRVVSPDLHLRMHAPALRAFIPSSSPKRFRAES